MGRASREGTLEPAELLQIARLIRSATAARRVCQELSGGAPLHAELAAELSDLDPLARELERELSISEYHAPVSDELRVSLKKDFSSFFVVSISIGRSSVIPELHRLFLTPVACLPGCTSQL